MVFRAAISAFRKPTMEAHAEAIRCVFKIGTLHFSFLDEVSNFLCFEGEDVLAEFLHRLQGSTICITNIKDYKV